MLFLVTRLNCSYSFTNPTYPTFSLSNVHGDTVLNSNNLIQMANGSPLSQGCNSGTFSYQTTSGNFSSTYNGTNGQSSSINNQFYTSGSNTLLIRTIQSTQGNLSKLNGNSFKLAWARRFFFSSYISDRKGTDASA
jgi:hypothetical protein